eukprot:809999-Karenia_brevis.AAC.1
MYPRVVTLTPCIVASLSQRINVGVSPSVGKWPHPRPWPCSSDRVIARAGPNDTVASRKTKKETGGLPRFCVPASCTGAYCHG